jgi:FkbM family methyltransferase
MKSPVKGFFRAVGYYPVRMRGIRLKGDPYHIAFWNEVNRNAWEPRTFDVLNEFIGPESTFVDVGSWIGPTAMFAAKKASRVYCLEPDPFAYECLLRNILVNNLSNMIPFHLALGATNGPRRMAILGGQLGNSRTSFLADGENKGQIETTCIRWSSWLASRHRARHVHQDRYRGRGVRGPADDEGLPRFGTTHRPSLAPCPFTTAGREGSESRRGCRDHEDL